MTDSSLAENGGSRRLHGVLVADMTGFSRMMGEDEARAVAALARIREIFSTVVPRHGGTLDVLVGDCFVALFDSAVEAVRAAMAIQTELAGAAGPAGTAVRIRIGIHLGDVVRSGAEILGDSVNIAARLQAIARPGGIAVSEDVYRAVRNRINIPFRDLGTKSLKNIREKMRIFEIHVEDLAGGGHGAERSLRPLALALVAILVIAGAAALAYQIARRPAVLGVAPMVDAGAPRPPAVAETITVGVTGVSAHPGVPAWMQDNTRDGLNTLLSKVDGIRVFSREKIDFLRQRRGLSEIEVAEALGIQKMISGSLVMSGDDVVIEVRIVDTPSGILDASASARGSSQDLIILQNQLATDLFNELGVRLSENQREELFARRTRETLDVYRRLAETFGEAPAEVPAESKPGERTSSWFWTTPAWAEASDGSEFAILALLEDYRTALEREDVEGVAATHVELSSQQRTGFERYFESADGLSVALTDIDILLDGDAALVTFTRRDAFLDRKSGREVELEVRLSSEVLKKDGEWRLRGVKRSS